MSSYIVYILTRCGIYKPIDKSNLRYIHTRSRVNWWIFKNLNFESYSEYLHITQILLLRAIFRELLHVKKVCFIFFLSFLFSFTAIYRVIVHNDNNWSWEVLSKSMSVVSNCYSDSRASESTKHQKGNWFNKTKSYKVIVTQLFFKSLFESNKVKSCIDWRHWNRKNTNTGILKS